VALRLALERGGDSVALRLALERGEGLPERDGGRPFGGPLLLFEPWALLCFELRTRGVCFVVCGFVCLFTFYYFQEGVFSPVIRGSLWLSMTVAPEPL
jgi:hypothetical protein